MENGTYHGLLIPITVRGGMNVDMSANVTTVMLSVEE